MKKLQLFLALIILPFTPYLLSAQAPMAIPYQAVARDNGGNPIANQVVSLRFTIRDVTAAGAIVYRETQSKTTNSLGLFTASIGQGNVVSGTFASINWGSGSKFMQVELDATGGSAYTDMGTQQMLSVPYALYSGKVAADTTPVVEEVNNIPSATFPDASCTGIVSTITVSAQVASVNSASLSVTLDITHTYDADLFIYLIAPNGSILCLASGNGGGGDNFTNTIFSDAGSTNISLGTAPFTGTFKPFGTLSSICSTTPTVSTFAAIGGSTFNPNGTWSLKIFDLGVQDVGTLNNWSISIANPVTGSTANYVPKWNGSSSFAPSTIFDNGNVGIGTTAPVASAKLEVSSTTQGFLPPRLTAAQRDAISNPVAGLVVYCTNCDELQLFNGTIWKSMSGAAASNFPNVTICSQKWMTKNLDVSTYRNGDPIPKVTDPAVWSGLTTGAYCYYNNDSATYAAVYGKLYNWYAVNDPRGLAPLGWHVPSDAEWAALETCLGGSSVAGGKMKEAGTTHWASPNAGATNSSGFAGLPGGYRNINGSFFNLGTDGYWWSSSESNTSFAWFRYLYWNDGTSGRDDYGKQYGFSVRCLRD